MIQNPLPCFTGSGFNYKDQFIIYNLQMLFICEIRFCFKYRFVYNTLLCVCTRTFVQTMIFP